MFTSASKEEILTRREFFRKSVKTALTVGALYNLSALMGCGGLSLKEEAPIIYPPLKGHKVQPPRDGCFIGFHGSWDRGTVKKLDYKDVSYIMSLYKEHLGHIPAFWTQRVDSAELRITYSYPSTFMANTHEQGIMPFLIYSVGPAVREHGGFEKLIDNISFIDLTRRYARRLAEHKIPCFIMTMREINLPPTVHQPWGGQSPKVARKVWRQIWQNFEDEGANEYATWVIEYIPRENYQNVYRVDPYYPGDDFVDWIGFSVYARKYAPVSDKPFSQIAGRTYRHMRRSHPDKPIMLSEFGKTRTSGQAAWLENAFATIKSWPGIKAVNYWNNTYIRWGKNVDDHTLGLKGMEVYRRIMNEGYFLGRRKG